MVNKDKNKKSHTPIEYTSRDFDSIKKDLLEHAKRYYPDTYKDFNQAGFGSLMIDTVSYVGDVLSFYLDYQANESFLDTATEYDNVIRHARRLGYDPFSSTTATSGKCSFFVTIPANNAGSGPNTDYMPTLKRGAKIVSKAGTYYTLEEDVDFGSNDTEIVVQASDPNGVPTHYAVKAEGLVLSGLEFETIISVGAYKPYRRIQILEPNLTEIISVVDSSGHQWHQVDYLSQDVVYYQVKNQNYDHSTLSPKYILKPVSVPRRFTTERNSAGYALQFGSGESLSEAEKTIDPSKVAINHYGRTHVSDRSFDPHKLVRTESLGAVPANVDLVVHYRTNNMAGADLNCAVGQIKEVSASRMTFENPSALDAGLKSDVVKTLEVINEVPISGEVWRPTQNEIKQRAKGIHASQHRAVTAQDYISLAYAMPPKFGKIKRCAINQDRDSLKRNVNLYVISENREGRLARTNDLVKYNLKTWLTDKKMINDYVDILPARIVNLEVIFSIVSTMDTNKFEVLQRCNERLTLFYQSAQPDIGEHFNISLIYKLLNSVPGVEDTIDVEVKVKDGSLYAQTKFDILTHTSADGRRILMPEDTIWEIRFSQDDIIGTVR